MASRAAAQPQQFTVTQILIAVNLLVALITYFRGGIDNSSTLLASGADVASLVKAGQYWRLLASVFLHIGIIHLAVNMYSLYNLGNLIEYLYGKQKFLIIYVLCGIGGNLLSNIFRTEGLSAGASGAIFGLIGAGIGLALKHRDQLNPSFKSAMLNGLVPVALYNFAFGLSVSFVNNWAHFGGFLTGLACGYFIYPNLAYFKERSPLSTQIGLGFVSLMLAYTAIFMLPSALNPQDSIARLPLKTVVDPHGFQISYPVSWHSAVDKNYKNDTLYVHSNDEEGVYLTAEVFSHIVIEDISTRNDSEAKKMIGDVMPLLTKVQSIDKKPEYLKIKNGWQLRYSTIDREVSPAIKRNIEIIWSKNHLYRFEMNTPLPNEYFYSKLGDKILSSAVVN